MWLDSTQPPFQCVLESNPGIKWPWHYVDHSHPSMPRLRMNTTILLLHLYAFVACIGTTLFCYLLHDIFSNLLIRSWSKFSVGYFLLHIWNHLWIPSVFILKMCLYCLTMFVINLSCKVLVLCWFKAKFTKNDLLLCCFCRHCQKEIWALAPYTVHWMLYWRSWRKMR